MTAFTAESVAPEWVEAVRAVPRARFLPSRIWPFDTASGRHVFVDRDVDPVRWQRAAEANVPVTVQWDDGRHDGEDGGVVPSSSASMPSLVLEMLADLDVRPGMTALEIGTGTGWNAGLLAHRLGSDAVTTVEVDAGVAERARRALKDTGLTPRVVTGDGSAGCSDGAPYDRLIVTCGMRGVPHAWIEQTRPGGVILVPWGTDYCTADGVAGLVVAADGRSAAGRFTRLTQFMKLRAHRLAWPRHDAYVSGAWPHGAVESTTDLGTEVVAHGPYDAAPFVLGMAVPRCAHVAGERNGETAAWFYSLSDSSWAAVRFAGDDGTGLVYQYGPRRLWDEVAAAWRWWDRQGRPGVGRFGLTVTRERTTPWLDSPDRPVPVTAV
ncbi:methyltransferase domain-containing protein [Streptomyces sp. MP131-18]|uniref:methyltransferase domain-containing protein n=1 Tax=Streptomyces sp. MP131-18 TaxID=1857892 RepID=UPI00097C4452|nr:methyltransferase domain-containing protein [Streptomyces sp. MP131-18]ONK13554.1 Protein-L-isoaspartate O-methyltransferase [Streptomyces sp. MP131-18]